MKKLKNDKTKKMKITTYMRKKEIDGEETRKWENEKIINWIKKKMTK